MKELRLHGDAIIIGADSIEYLKQVPCKRVYIVTGQGSAIKNGAVDRIKTILEEKNCRYGIFSGIKKNPSTEEVMAGVTRMRSFKPDTVIGIGGGSAIDAAKVMCLFSEYPDWNFERARKEELPSKRETVKLIAIPTTSGTGTEVTRVSVITYKEDNIKIGLKSTALIPDIAILDAQLTLSMPKHVVAETGMDAMTHAVESYINKNLDDYTACLASGAVEGLFDYLPSSYEQGDLESREKVHNYQSIAGSVLTNVGLGMAHGISHSLGGMFDYGHGLLNAVLLPYVLQYNKRDAAVSKRLEYLARRIGKPDFAQAVKELNQRIGIPSSFKEMGLSRDVFDGHFQELLDNSMKGSTRVNPVAISRAEMARFLEYVYEGRDIDF